MVNKIGKEIFSNLRIKLFSPLYLVIMTISVILIGNFLNWLAAFYDTRFTMLNSIMVILIIILFGMYLYSIRNDIRTEYRKNRKK